MVSAILTMNTVQDLITRLKKTKYSVACSGKDGLLAALVDLGFKYKSGNGEWHKIFTHRDLSLKTASAFTAFSIDCGHKPKKEMKINYVLDVIRVLETYQVELQEILKNRSKDHD